MRFRLQPVATTSTFAANLWEVGNTPTGNNKLLERKVSGVS